jgi:Cu/Ag efflux pump CusA
LAVLPVFFMEGLSSALFRPLVVSYILAVLASMAVALILTPTLSLILLPNAPLAGRESPLVRWLQRGYGVVLARTVRNPRLAYVLMALLIVAGVVGLPFIRQNQLLPTFKEPYLTIQLEAAPGTSLPAMNSTLAQITSELRVVPGVSDVAAHIGRAVFGDKVVGINYAEVWVNLDPQTDYNATVDAVEATLDGYSGLDRQVQTYLQQVVGQSQTSASDALTLRVLGEDHKVLREQAEKLQQVLAGIDGVVDPQVVLPKEEPTVEIEVDLDSAQLFGVKPGDVRRAAATLLSGIQVGSLFEEQKVFDVVVWSTPETRDSIEDISQLLVDTPGGGHVRLGEVADVRIVNSPTVIHREGVSPYRDVVFTVQGRNAEAVISDVKAAIQKFAFPLEYHAVVLEDFAAQQATQQRLLISGIMAAFGIFLLLQASTLSWRLAAATFLTLLAALAGGVLAALLGGSFISLGSLFGFLTILGIAARNSILTINHYGYLERQEGESFGPELVLRGSRERIAPTLMTALTTGLALLPFLLFGGTPGLEIVRPLAIVVLGGLVTSTIVTLFVVPALYLRFGASREAELELIPVTAGD